MSMIVLGAMTAVVLALDWTTKQAVIHGLGSRVIRLGPFGELRVIESRVWIARGSRVRTARAMWLAWTAAAIIVTVGCAFRPQLVWCSSLLLGGSLSHAIDTQRTGRVRDYVCLRFWPAFDAADVAIAIGGWAIVLELLDWVRAGV
jgi:signal peptidase II